MLRLRVCLPAGAAALYLSPGGRPACAPVVSRGSLGLSPSPSPSPQLPATSCTPTPSCTPSPPAPPSSQEGTSCHGPHGQHVGLDGQGLQGHRLWDAIWPFTGGAPFQTGPTHPLEGAQAPHRALQPPGGDSRPKALTAGPRGSSSDPGLSTAVAGDWKGTQRRQQLSAGPRLIRANPLWGTRQPQLRRLVIWWPRGWAPTPSLEAAAHTCLPPSLAPSCFPAGD